MVEKYPDFSVLMSVYKMENPEFLYESFMSILNQSVVPTEIILVEDGVLPQNLLQIIEKISKNCNALRVIKIEKNQGLGNALKVGTKYVNTNLIARMDTDDLCAPNRFELQLNEFMKNRKLTLSGGQVAEFEQTVSNIVGYRKVPIKYNDILKFAKLRSPFNHPTVMMRKDALLQVGGYEDFSGLEDYYLWEKFLSKGLLASNLSDVLVYMRVDSGMYNRRGGFQYWTQYCSLKRKFYNDHFINFEELMIGDLAMLSSILMPTVIRKLLYKKILHKD
jgi:glycosyltransferase involved in cell wall biosynthesis